MDDKKTPMNPEYILKYYSRLPNFKVFLKAVQDVVSQNVDANYEIWGDKIFIPFEVYGEVAKSCVPEMMVDDVSVPMIYTSVIWNFCKSVYKFDDAIFNLICESSSKKIPIDIFLNLKEWAICIDLKNKGLTLNGKKVTCSILSLSDASQEARKLQKCTVHLTVGLENPGNKTSYTFPVPMISDDLDDCLLASEADRDFIYEKVGVYRPMAEQSERIDILKKILNLYLYILSENSTIVNKNLRSLNYKDYKHHKRIFSPVNIKTWIIKPKNAVLGEKDFQKTSTLVRPHIRRGHFHGYWVGPKSNPVDLIIKWIPPIYINAHKVN